MRTTSLAALLLIGLSACSGNPQSLTADGYTALGSGDNKAALADFEKALDKIGTDTKSPEYLRAAIGRCQALTRIDPKKAAADFIALAGAQKNDVHESDFTLIADGLLKANTAESRLQAIEVMKAAMQMFPKSTKLREIGDMIFAAATKANDPESLKALQGIGYVGK